MVGLLVALMSTILIKLIVYEPTKGSSYIPLPAELQNSRKGLVNLKNEDNECFRWCHIRYLNPQEKDAQRIKKTDRKMVEELSGREVSYCYQTLW